MLLEQALSFDPRSPELRTLVRRFSFDEDAARRLLARVLLHLPRLADQEGGLCPSEVEREVERLRRGEWIAPGWMQAPGRRPVRPAELSLVEIEPERARYVHEHFHYLRSYRQGMHLAGQAEGRVAVLLTFSPLDLGRVRETLPEPCRGNGLVLSRVYATAWAPKNSLSYLLGQAMRRLRASAPRPGVVLTYLNPNVGFDGASYKAANWCLFGREHGTRYAYLDQRYVTDRELSSRFGASQATALEELLGDRVAFSSMPLRPLEMYAYALDHRLRRYLSGASLQEWQRPWA